MPGTYPAVVTTFTANTSEAVSGVNAFRGALAELQATFAEIGSVTAAFEERLAAVSVAAGEGRTAIVEVGDAASTLGEKFTAAKDGAASLSSSVQGLNRSTSTLLDRLTANGDALQTLAERATAAESGMTTFGVRVAELGDEVKILQTSLKDAAASMTAMAAAADKAAASQKKVTDSAAANKTALSETGASFGMVSAAIGITDYATAKAAGNMQANLIRLKTEAGLTDDQINQFAGSMSGLQEKVIAVGNATGYTGTEISQALYEPISAGLSLSQALDAVHYAAEEAQISGANLEDTTIAVTSVMKNFGDSISSPKQAVADLNAIVGNGMMRFQDFNDSVKTWAPTAATFGVSLNSVGAALAYMTDRGESADTAGTKLAMVMSQLVGQTNMAGQLMQGLGLSTDEVTSSSQAMQEAMQKAHIRTSQLADDLRSPDGLFVALEDLKTHLENAGLSADTANSVLVRAFGGAKTFRGLGELIENLDQLQQKFEAIQNDSTAQHFQEQWDAVSQTFNVQWSMMTASMKNFAISIGNQIIPVLGRVVQVFAGVFKAIYDNQTAVHALGTAFSVLSVALPIMALGNWVSKMSSATQATLMTTAKIAAFSAMLDYGFTHLNSVTGVIATVIGSLGALSTAWDLLSGPIGKMKTAIGTAISELGAWMTSVTEAEGAMATLQTIGSGVMDFLTGPWGIALAVAAGALMLFTSNSNDATTAQSDLTEAIDNDSGALGEHTRKLVLNQLEAQGAADAARKLGVSMADMTDAALGNQGAIDRVNDAIDRMHSLVQQGGGAWDRYAASIGQSGEGAVDAANAQIKLQNALNGTRQSVQASVQVYKDQQAAGVGAASGTQAATTAATSANKPMVNLKTVSNDVAVAMGSTGAASTDMASSAMDAGTKVSSALSEISAAVKILTDQLDLLNGINIDEETALIDFKTKIDNVTSSVKSNGKALDVNTAAGRANMTAITDAATAAQKHAEMVYQQKLKVEDQTSAQKDATAAFADDVTQLKEVMKQAGFTAQQIDNLIGQYAQVPKDVSTTVTVNTAVNGPLAAPAAGSVTKLNALGIKALGLATGGTVGAYGPGGIVQGPGTETSDSIATMLSRNEFVVKAASAEQATYPVLNAINDGDLAKAYSMLGSVIGAGGNVGGSPAPAGFRGGSATVVNVYLQPQGSIYAQSDLQRDVQQIVLRYAGRNSGPGWTPAFS